MFSFPLSCEGLQKLAELETVAAWILSWKEDFGKDEDIKSCECLDELMKVQSAHPCTSHLGIALYSVMVGDLIVNPKDDAAEYWADVQAFRTFSTQVLKVAKKDIPTYITSRFDKMSKDRGVCFSAWQH